MHATDQEVEQKTQPERGEIGWPRCAVGQLLGQCACLRWVAGGSRGGKVESEYVGVGAGTRKGEGARTGRAILPPRISRIELSSRSSSRAEDRMIVVRSPHCEAPGQEGWTGAEMQRQAQKASTLRIPSRSMP